MQKNQALPDKDEKVRATQKALGEPFGLEFKDAAIRMRTHLLVCAAISIFATLLELKIKPDVPVFGVQFEGLTEKKILIGLLTLNLYLLLHFLWTSIDVFREWRLRRTGTMVAYIDSTTHSFFGNEFLDFGDDPRQSTLYRWWCQATYRMSSLPKSINNVEETINSVTERVTSELNRNQVLELAELQKNFMSLRQQLSEIKTTLESTKKIIESERIPASLERFDDAFKNLLSSQNIRWVLLEWFFPLLLGLIATGMIVHKILWNG